MNKEITISLENGKYTYSFLHNGVQLCYRHGEPWRDLTGDNLVLAMAQKIKELEMEVEKQRGILVKAGNWVNDEHK